MNCSYLRPGGNVCPRVTVGGSNRCIFHCFGDIAFLKSTSLSDQYFSELATLINEKDGQWQGFIFPNTWRLSGATLDFEIDARDARFESVHLEDVTFLQKVDMSNAKFNGSVTVRKVTFSGEAVLEYTEYEAGLIFEHVTFKRNASFRRGQFKSDVFIRAHFESRASLSEASFRGRAHFAGWRNISLSVDSARLTIKGSSVTSSLTSRTSSQSNRNVLLRVYGHLTKAWRTALANIRLIGAMMARRLQEEAAKARQELSRLRRRISRTSRDVQVFPLFGAEVQFTDITFSSPDLVYFSTVDMSRAYVTGTNLRGARFLDVTWWQPTLRRNGLYDEVFAMETDDGPFRWRFLPVLEETYRNVRVALEESKNYGAAADFYVGEMEAHRKRLGFWRGQLFSVPAWYQALSTYGTSVTRGVSVLLLLLLGHSVVTALWHPHEVPWPLDELLLRSVRLATLQENLSSGANHTNAQLWVDTIFRILAAIQLTLVVFAFRTRIRRH